AFGAEDPGLPEIQLREPHLDPCLVQGRQRALETLGGPAPDGQLPAEALEELLLPALVLPLEDGGDQLLQLVRAGGLDIDLDPPGEALPEVGVQVVEHPRQQLLGAPDHQALDPPLLVEIQEPGGDVAEVTVDVVLDVALVAGLAPAALVVPARDVGVPLVDDLLEGRLVPAKNPRPVALNERDADRPARDQDSQRLEVGRRLDGNRGVDRLRQLEDLEEVPGIRDEDGEAMIPVVPVRMLEEPGAQLLDVLAQLLA